MIPHIHTFATMSTKPDNTPESSENVVYNEEIEDFNPDNNEQKLYQLLFEREFVDNNFKGNVADVPFIQSTAAEAIKSSEDAASAKSAEATEATEAAEAAKFAAFEAAKAAKAAKAAAIEASIAAEDNVWGQPLKRPTKQ